MRIKAQWPALVLAGIAVAQTPPPQPQTAAPETTTKEEPAVFRTRVTLVMGPDVVRDRKGQAVGTLKQEDFQLLDRGKPQTILRFAVEKPGSHPVKPSEGSEGAP